jgi:predicted Fe-Mo cluster-binding NifX family protein
LLKKWKIFWKIKKNLLKLNKKWRMNKMKIGISATSDSLDANVDTRFGRCPYFVIVDSESMEFNVVSNDSTNASHGAGIQAAQTIANMGVEVIITGNIGPNAFNVISASGVTVITGVSGNIKEAVEKYKNGQLKEAENPSVGGHFGIGRGFKKEK